MVSMPLIAPRCMRPLLKCALLAVCALLYIGTVFGNAAVDKAHVSPAAIELDARLGLPAATIESKDSNTRAKVLLGRTLFFDKRLSADGTVSCASCHIPEKGFTDGRALAVGIGGSLGARHTPSLLNVGLTTSEFWDGRRASLEAQALDPLFNPREQGLQDRTALIRFLRGDRAYQSAFRAAFDVDADEITLDQLRQALASFERTLWAGGSPFDRYEYNGDRAALSPAAQRGLSLFRGRAQCATCHTIGPKGAAFTDGQFHSLGVGFSKIAPNLASTAIRVANSSPEALDKLILSDTDVAELGRFNVTRRPEDIGRFKTPSLRNVALTAPYMHDGSVRTLSDAVDLEIYYRSLDAGRPLILTPAERVDIVEFLNALTSPYATSLVDRTNQTEKKKRGSR